MAEEKAATSTENVMLSKTLGVTADVPNWSVSEYCTHYGRMLDASWFSVMFPDGRSSTMVDRRGIRQDTDIGERGRRWSAMRP